MSNLVGTGLNQVPTNGMLGGLAYQDPNHASIKDLDLKNLSQINSEIADTAVDVFVYDTRKDSDGGAWRKRTQNTSWYNETLNTATRGSRKEFPAVAVIVAETTKLTIYDGDDPDLPMWMVFTSVAGKYGGIYGGRTIKSPVAKNGEISFADSVDSVVHFNFITDTIKSTSSSGSWNSQRNLADRNPSDTNNYWTNYSSGRSIVGYPLNDVAMTVLPNAPIDSATGLPTPTIAVATASGVSVIKDDGTVVDITASAGGSYSSSKFISMSSDGLLVFPQHGSSATTGEYSLMTIPIPSSDRTTQTNSSNATDKYIFNDPNTLLTSLPHGLGTSQNGALRIPGTQFLNYPNGLAILDENPTSLSKAMVAYIAFDYNTGWMHGDIKGAFLSDTDTTNVGSNLVNNGDFADTNLTNYFTLVNSDANAGAESESAPYVNGSNQVVMGNSAQLKTYYNLVAGTSYKVSYDCVNLSSSAQRLGIYIPSGQSLTFDDSITAGATNTYYYTATTTGSTFIEWRSRGGGWGTYDNFSIIEAEEDRSVNNNPLQVFGTVTKSAVATGAELVAYSGYSASNYLEQPYNSVMDIFKSTSSTFSMTGWIKRNSTNTGDVFFSTGRPGFTGEARSLALQSNGKLFFYGWNSAYDSGTTAVTAANIWTHFHFSYVNGVHTWYVNGELDSTHNKPLVTYTENMPIKIGDVITTTGQVSRPINDSLSLLRISGSAPTAEQVKKMYEDEKHLFVENAKCTLYGSSNAVTALAFDDTTELLHVGTSAGRSEFQGLRRINNTTTAVTTAISASNDLVAEQ